MKKYNYFYNNTPITKKQFLMGVPNNWENEIENGIYYWGYYKAEEIN
jgi:hypothetical protein